MERKMKQRASKWRVRKLIYQGSQDLKLYKNHRKHISAFCNCFLGQSGYRRYLYHQDNVQTIVGTLRAAARPWLIRWRHYRAVLCGDSNGGPLWPVSGYNIELKNFKAPRLSCSTGPRVSNLPKLCCVELLTIVPPPHGPATGGGPQGPISLEYQICPSHYTI